jgi:hypothetical protein
MRKQILCAMVTIVAISVFFISCQKEANSNSQQQAQEKAVPAPQAAIGQAADVYNFDVNLYGEGERKGIIRFRQDPDAAKIMTLYTKIQNLLPNHEYQLQRAVDRRDGNCTSTTWLTLGLGLTPQTIMTDDEGNGHELLWRDISALESGSSFDIHFQITDAVSHEVVLTSDCYQFTVR